MKLFAPSVYTQRRQQLLQTVGSGLILLCGNDEAPMNYHDNTYRYRQDSSFLYFMGLNLAGLNATLDCDTGEVTLFGNDWTIDDTIWMGPQPTLAELADRVGVTSVKPFNSLADALKAATKVHYLPPYRYDNQLKVSEWLNKPVNSVKTGASEELIKAVIAQRAYKSEAEVAEMEAAVNATRAMHIAAMQAAAEGKMEYQLVAELYGTAKRFNGELAYPAILSIDGQTLHNHHHSNMLINGRLVLNDSGAELEMGYCGDITRTFPVSNSFTQQQKEIYEIVLEMEESVIASLKPGLPYRDCHIAANRLMLSKLKELDLVNGDVDTMLEVGVGGLFMPHGLGHMIGLDVHDMEDLGENYVGYASGQQRSTQLGLKSLRLARPLESGFVLTVEPGIYFIPELIDKYRSENRFTEFVNYQKLENYKSFGGIRIEDNVLITNDGFRVLGERIPKSIAEVEALRNP